MRIYSRINLVLSTPHGELETYTPKGYVVLYLNLSTPHGELETYVRLMREVGFIDTFNSTR